jgi:ABC-type glycerol-3-phosphate transport system substrate-binding protein
MLRNKNKILISSLLVLATLFFSGCGTQPVQPQYKGNLEIWGLFDDKDAFSGIFENYTLGNPGIARIDYRKLTPDTYKQDLLEALASGQGPDIFLINNFWLAEFKDKIAPAPVEILSEPKIKRNFVDVVANDFVAEGKVFAVPLSVDSLGLYYNKDLFNAAGITMPPADWETFVKDARKMTRIDNAGQIVQSGASMGTAYNINRSPDILAMLMMQNGTKMVNDGKNQTVFDSANYSTDGKLVSPGINALDFYTQFAKLSSPAYTWNKNMHYSVDAFSEGKAAMMFNYSWQRDTILAKSPKLNFDVAPVPQLGSGPPIDYANYWGFVVLKNKPVPASVDSTGQSAPISNDARIKEAWKFLSYLTMKPELNPAAAADSAGNQKMNTSLDPAKKYAEKTRKPSGRRDLIELQKSDPIAGVFAEQNLIAKSWYQADALATEAIFAEMIDQVNRGQFLPAEAIKSAAVKINQIMGRR